VALLPLVTVTPAERKGEETSAVAAVLAVFVVAQQGPSWIRFYEQHFLFNQ